MTERQGGMTRWRVLAEDGLDQLAIALLGSPQKKKRLIQYEVAGAEPGTFQGQAFMASGGEGSATKSGVWLPGAHVAASDKDLDAWMDNLEVSDSGLLLYHFCAKAKCRAKSSDHDVASHITSFRLMPPLQALEDSSCPGQRLECRPTSTKLQRRNLTARLRRLLGPLDWGQMSKTLLQTP